MLEIMIFGNTLKQILMFILFIFIGIIVSKIASYFSKNVFKKIAEKTKTKFDDILVSIMEKPLPFMLIITIIFFEIGFRYLTVSSSFQNIITKIVFLLYVFCIAWFLAKFILGIIDEYITKIAKKTKTKYDDQLVPLLKTLTNIVIVAFAGVLVLSNFGYDVGALLAGLGIGGIAVALAAKDALENLISGVVLFGEKNFNIGDFVEINGEVGTVKAVGLRSAQIQKTNGTLMIMPNSKIAGSTISNISYRSSKRIDTTLGLTYSTSTAKLNKAKAIVKEILKNNKNILPDFYIRFDEFNSYSLDVKVTYYINELNWGKYIQIKDKINTEIKTRFEKEKIEFAFPTQTIELKK